MGITSARQRLGRLQEGVIKSIFVELFSIFSVLLPFDVFYPSEMVLSRRFEYQAWDLSKKFRLKTIEQS